MAKPSTVRDLRRANRAALLCPLFFGAPLTRPELSELSGLSQASVSNVIAELLAEGVVVEVGAVESNGGRPRQLLRIAAEYGCVVGVDVGETRVRTEVFDLSMRVLAAADVPLPHGPEVDDVVEVTRSSVAQVIAASGVARSAVLGVGVGVPGLVERGEEPLVHGQTIGWQAVPMVRLLNLDLPVTIDNGAKTLGQAEMWFGAGRGARDAVVALFGTGVGASIVTGGRTYRGATSSAGEWGHTSVSLEGPACRCGACGCLEAYVGADALARRLGEARGSPVEGGSDAAVRALVDASPGTGAAGNVLAETAEYIGLGMANLINLFNPERIVIGGWVGLQLGPKLLPMIRESVARRALYRPLARTEIILAELGVDAVSMGAATLPLERFLSSGAAR